MIDPSLIPSRLLRTVANIARWSLGLVLAFWFLLAAAWGTLHGLIVPRIGEWRVQVEQLATQALGTPVEIAEISAQSNHFFPTVHLTGVSVFDAQGRVALKLQSVVAAVSARSLLRLGLEQLYIEGPELDIRHLADGRWQVAGLDVVQSDATESQALNWLLEQPELIVQKGRVYFTDERRFVATQQWSDVDVVLRNRHWSHVLRVDATPAAGVGERMHLVGAFRQPLLPSSKAPWANWSGQWYATLQLEQLPQLPWPQGWGIQSLRGEGVARAWIDVANGQTVGVTADVALPQLHVEWSNDQVPDLAVRQLKGRFEGRQQAQHWWLSGSHFTFLNPEGSFWPSSSFALALEERAAGLRGIHLELDYADLAMASQVVQAMPIPDVVRKGLLHWAPQGALRQLQVDWTAAGSYAAKGRVERLFLPPQAAEQAAGVPGVEGLSASFDFNQRGGRAALTLQDGALHFPGVFEEPVIALQSLHAQVRWTIDNGKFKVDVPEATFSNEDAQGRVQGWWQTGDSPSDRLPGYLQLRGVLERANGAKVYRYLPLEVPATARHYVRDSVKQGRASQVEFEVHGNLQDMPFDRPNTGRFFIKAPVQEVEYDFAPASLFEPGQVRWPALTQLQGTLVFEGASMQVLQAQTGFAGHPQLRMGEVNAYIPDLEYPHLTVRAQGQTDLQAALGLVKQSPVAVWTDHALDEAQAQGQARIAFDLDLPIEHLEAAKVRGQVGFQNNQLQFSPTTPQMQQLQGKVQFHDQGFDLLNVQGQSLGGTFRIDGGMPSVKQGVRLQARGTATAAGLQKEGAVPALAEIARHASGQTPYSVEVVAQQGGQKIMVRSELRGLAVDLPAPLNKSAAESVNLSVEQAVNAQRQQTLRVEVAGRGWVRYVEDLASTPPKVLRGQIVVGEGPSELLDGDGVSAWIRQPEVDVDAWWALLQSMGWDAMPSSTSSTGRWLPQRISLDVQRVRLMERELEDVRADFARAAGLWRGSVKARQFSGQLEYRLATVADPGGRVFARLAHLSIPKSEAQRVESEAREDPQTETSSLPALDVEVERLEVAGKALGKLELKAYNTQGRYGRDWTLEQFDLTTPEARWRANGYWGKDAPSAPRSTHLSFLLEMDSAGKLLERFGMPGVIRDGKGRLSGQLAWQGTFIAPQWNSMDGNVHMQVEKGQFLKVEPGMGKLLSVLSLQSLTRRIALDFRDIFSQGFAFDFIRGDVSVTQGVAHTSNLQMKGLNAAVLMEGQANLVDETQDLKVVVVPEINAMTASLAATALNPVIGVGSFLAQMLLRGPLRDAATRVFHIQGTWADPQVIPVSNKSLAVPEKQSGAQP